MTADDRRPMPPPPPPAHPDLDTVADLQAEALDGPAAERVRDHLAACPQCSGVLAALDGVRDELRALPTPAMPAAVASRLDAALADLRRTGLPTPDQAVRPQPAPDRTGAPVGDARPAAVGDLAAVRERRRRRLTRSLGGVAAAVAVIAAGASVTALIRTGGGADNSASTAAGTAASTAAGSARSGTKDSAGAAEVPSDGTLGPGIALAVPSYDRSTLRSALPTIAQQSAVSIITGGGDTGPAGVMADTARRTACAGTIRGTSGELQAVQRIRYEGKPAYVFVFEDNGRQTGYVVSDACGISSALPATVLDTVS